VDIAAGRKPPHAILPAVVRNCETGRCSKGVSHWERKKPTGFWERVERKPQQELASAQRVDLKPWFKAHRRAPQMQD